jgi:hypothetical protein
LKQKGINSHFYTVPYSDHSSVEELITFIKVVNPKKITPITHTNQRDVDKIEKIFFPYLRASENEKFVDFYFKPK